MAAAVDPVSFVASTVRPMAGYTFPFVCSILGIESEQEGKHVGSAFRVRARGKRLLVTAKHVIDEARSSALGAGFVEKRGEAPVRLTRTPDLTDDVGDLVAFVLGDAGDDSPDCFPASLIDADSTARAHDYLFVHGFPGERARFLFGESHHRSLPYGVMERDDDLPADRKPFEFAMDYDPKNMRLEFGGEATLAMPPGLSGSPVWRIGAYHEKPEAWQPSGCRLVGVVTRWDQVRRVLLATDVARLAAMIGGLS